MILRLLAIVALLASAALFMLKGRGDSQRMAKALGWRIALSVALFVLLMAGYFFGLLEPGKL